jgi:hypothetical protein
MAPHRRAGRTGSVRPRPPYFKSPPPSLGSSTLTPHFAHSHWRPFKIVIARVAKLPPQRGQRNPKAKTPITLIRRKPRTASRNIWFSQVACQLPANTPTAMMPIQRKRNQPSSVVLMVIAAPIAPRAGARTAGCHENAGAGFTASAPACSRSSSSRAEAPSRRLQLPRAGPAADRRSVAACASAPRTHRAWSRGPNRPLPVP